MTSRALWREGAKFVIKQQLILLAFHPTQSADADSLVALRIAAMQESLERVGRFDPVRARERFLGGFDPACTWHVELGAQRVGFFVVKPAVDHLLLDHLYIHPDFQRRGFGAAVLRHVTAQADRERLELRLAALIGSDSNRFYQRHGFVEIGRGEFDIHYARGIAG